MTNLIGHVGKVYILLINNNHKRGKDVMKSIWYMLCGKPVNIDDCIDIVNKKSKKPVTVSVTLKMDEYPHETLIFVRQFIAGINWTFENKTLYQELVCGACFVSESLKQQKAKIEKANQRLKVILERIRTLEISVNPEDMRYDYSCIIND